MYCKDCGKKMKELPTGSSWESKYECKNPDCMLKCNVGHGDWGSPDMYYYHGGKR